MDNKIIDIWKTKLLDLGKRNNLINFKDNRTSTLELISPDFYQAYNKLNSNMIIHIYDDKKNNDEEERCQDIEDYMEKHISKLKDFQFLLYNRFVNNNTILKSLFKKSQESLLERGVNILYFSFGFLRWKEDEKSDTYYDAPLILVPINLKNESRNKPYFIQLIDDDIMVNATLEFMLKHDFNITLPEFDSDDLEGYIKNVKDLISPLGFTISLDARLSTFSFNKLNMYLDIENNSDKILNNSNIKAMLNENTNKSLTEEEVNEIENKKDLFYDLHNVVDADFSQSLAISYALKGESFVLQGPPGTGKSQTITNMISELIYAGKKVLFVSEKMAALSIVQKNLEKVGLGDYSLELHSFKANKKDFIDELYNTLTKNKIKTTEAINKNKNELFEAISNLNQYDDDLNKIYEPISLSLREIIENALYYSKYLDPYFIIKDINNIGDKEFNNNINLLSQYESLKNTIGYNYKLNPLYGLNITDNSYSFKIRFKELLTKDLENDDKISKLLIEAEKYNINLCHANKLYEFNNFIKFVKEYKINKELFDIELLNNILTEINKLDSIHSEMTKYKNDIDKYYKESVYELNGYELYKEYKNYNSFFKRLFNSKYKNINKELLNHQLKDNKFNYDTNLNNLKLLSQYQLKIKDFNSILTIDKYNISVFNGINTNFIIFKDVINKLIEYLNSNPEFKNVNNYDNYDEFDNKVSETEKIYNELTNELNQYFDHDVYNLEILSNKNRINVLQDIIDNYDLIDDWASFGNLYNELKKNNLLDFINKIVSLNYDISDIASYYKLSFYNQWADYIISNNNKLQAYTKFIHNKDVEKVINDDKLELELSRLIIDEKLSKLRPNEMIQVSGSPASVIIHEHEKKKKIKPIRKIMEEIPSFIQRIKPVFLMSPLSVSTYLSPDLEFDTVIFDEASQVFPYDAVVAIYRAKQLIVVGDSKQMPPTNFFMASDNDEEYDDDNDLDAFESILDLSLASLPTKSLLCHYRSKSEDLISFSNNNFYNNNLLTYPSASNKELGFGVDFYYVENGIMDSKAKANLIEANKVVDMIYDHFKTYPERSLGVVAFNIHQQDAIIKLLDKRRLKDSSIEEFLNQDRNEAFFIKNLETVQGDERDTIIFSIAYAKNENGNFALRFGPLNLDGGERRLNVAITRAKINVKVVSSIKSSDIDPNRITNLGPKLLRDYLYYAENGMNNKINNINEFNYDKPKLEDDVFNFLINKGFDVEKNVGKSKYKIDIALKNKETSNYVLAIECDGFTYHDFKSARDRERIRKEMLSRLGWNYYRVWSLDWYKNNDNEKNNLVEACKNALTENYQEIITKSKNYANKYVVEIESDVNELFDEYKEFEDIMPNNVTEATKRIAKIEAPISIDVLLKKIGPNLLGITRINKKAYDIFYQNYRSNDLLLEEGFIYTLESKNYALRENIGRYVPDIDNISLYEIRNGMYTIIKENGNCKKDDLFDSVRLHLGYSRRTEKINNRLETAFKLLMQNIFIDLDGNIIINEFNKLNIIKRQEK